VRLARLLTTVSESKSPNEQLTAVLKFYRPLMKNKYDDAQRRGRDLEHLQSIAKRYKTSAKLLEDISLDPTEALQGSAIRRGGFVTLSTVHSAKGLEWSHVFIIWMTDGWFPSNRFQDEFDDLDEERRLLYVATEGKAGSEVCLPGQRASWARHRWHAPSQIPRTNPTGVTHTQVWIERSKCPINFSLSFKMNR
jgi:DNA helicase-2/ATP-dependent DNA helicase PcrA